MRLSDLRNILLIAAAFAVAGCEGDVEGSVYTRTADGAGVGLAGVLVAIPDRMVETFTRVCEAYSAASAAIADSADAPSMLLQSKRDSGAATARRAADAIGKLLYSDKGLSTWTDVDGHYLIRGVPRGPAFLFAADFRQGRNYVWIALVDVKKDTRANLADSHLAAFKSGTCPSSRGDAARNAR